MSTYVDVQLMSGSFPIQEYEIELKIESWKKRHTNAHIVNTETKKHESSYYNYSIFLIITYQANCKVASGYKSSEEQLFLKNYPSNYDPLTEKVLDASKGSGYVARESGRFGSLPSHDDYSEESSE